MTSWKGLYESWAVQATKGRALKYTVLGCSILLTTTSLASGPIFTVQTTTGPATPLTYSKNGNDYHWGQGDNLYLTGFLFDSDGDGQTERYIPRLSTQNIVLNKGENPTANSERCTIFAEVHAGNLSYKPSLPLASNSATPTPPGEYNCDIEAIMSSNIINIGVKNIDVFERIDFIFTPGIIAPIEDQLSRTGHIVTDKASAADSVIIAAITALDSTGTPSAFGSVVNVGPSGSVHMGQTNVATIYAFLQNELNSPRGYPTLLYVHDEQQALTAAFITLDDLGVSAGQEYFGFALFSTNPNSSHPGGADIYGGLSGLYMMDNETVNSAPVTANDNASTLQGTAITVDVLANDSDPDGDTLAVISTTTSTQGVTATINPDQTITYLAPEDFTGTDSFTYNVSDGNGGDASAVVTIHVTQPEPDFDNDGIIDAIDIDDDNDGILDTAEGNADYDGDGFPNHLDLDADGDGILDLEESGMIENQQAQLDTDGDGQIDAGNAFGDNGLADQIETAADSALTDYNSDGQADGVFDTDNDSHPDFMDLDTDSDGISDVIEGGFVDTNNDGAMDAGQTPTISPPDTDADGLDDYRDIEEVNLNDLPVAVNDSATTAMGTAVSINVLANDSDPDGDTLTVLTATSEQGGVVTINSDQSITYLPPDNFVGSDTLTYEISDGNGGTATAIITVTVTGNAAGHGPPHGNEGVLESGLKGQGASPGLASLVFLLFFGLLKLLTQSLKRKTAVQEAIGQSTTGQINSKQILVTSVLIMLSTSVIADSSDDSEREFDRRFYLGAGAGISQMEPRHTTAAYIVDDNKDTAGQIFFGYDISRRLSIEAFYSDLGEAGIANVATGNHAGHYGYKLYGVSALGYLYNSRDSSDYDFSNNDKEGYYRHEGLSIYARIGISSMDNDSNLNYDTVYNTDLHLGGGLEYGFSNGFALRADLVSYDDDAQLFTLAVLKRFGTVSKPVKPKPPVVVESSTKPAAVKPAIKEKAPGSLTVPVIHFAFDKSGLTPSEEQILQNFAAQLKQNPDLLLEVRGHTDSVGTRSYNQQLSVRRAQSVSEYLLSLGVNTQQLKVTGYGEDQPVASNATKIGRGKNRRTDFKDNFSKVKYILK